MGVIQEFRTMIRGARKTLQARRRAARGLAAVDQASRDGFPARLVPAVAARISGCYPAEVLPQLSRIEELRRGLSSQGGVSIPVLYSPEPGRVDPETGRPRPGDTREFLLSDLAQKTSVNPGIGAFLHILANALGAVHVLELGSCVGIGSAYLASSKSCRHFVTLEGSPRLAEIALGTVRQVNPTAEVVTALFDEGLDRLLPSWEGGIDLAWIDGHHEKLATLHYLRRIQPLLNEGSVVVFDDIHWSQDMLEAWAEICGLGLFSDTVDLGDVGLGLYRRVPGPARRWDFSGYIGSGIWRSRKPDSGANGS